MFLFSVSINYSIQTPKSPPPMYPISQTHASASQQTLPHFLRYKKSKKREEEKKERNRKGEKGKRTKIIHPTTKTHNQKECHRPSVWSILEKSSHTLWIQHPKTEPPLTFQLKSQICSTTFTFLASPFAFLDISLQYKVLATKRAHSWYEVHHIPWVSDQEKVGDYLDCP